MEDVHHAELQRHLRCRNRFLAPGRSTMRADDEQGAIFASIGITSLQVPSIDQTHWVVKALLTSSMALGILSSISATSLQRHITYLNDPTAIRLWLSRGALDRTYDRRGRPSLFSQLPLESSVSALQVCDRPSILLGLAFALFIIGFGLYLLFLWLYEIDRRGADSRKVFIFFTCVVCAAVFQKFYVSIDRALEKGLMDRQFNLRPPDTFDKSSEIRDLERKLTQLQSVQRSRQDTSRMEDDDHEYNPFLRGTMRLPRNPDSRLERRGHGEIDAA